MVGSRLITPLFRANQQRPRRPRSQRTDRGQLLARHVNEASARGSSGSCAARAARALECATAIPISILVAVSISISLSFCGCQSVFGCCANICLVLRHLPYLQFNLMQMQTDKWETSIKYAHNSLDNYRINKTDYFLTHQDTKGREAAATSQTMPGYPNSRARTMTSGNEGGREGFSSSA